MTSQCESRPPVRPLETLVEQAAMQLERLGYCAMGITNYRGIWNRFVRFVRKNDPSGRFTVEMVDRYLADRGVPGPGEGALRASQRHARSAMRILTEVALHGSFQRRRNSVCRAPLGAPWQSLLEGYERFCHDERRMAPRGMRQRRREVWRFLNFLEARGVRVPREIDAAALSGFVGLLTQVRPVTLASTVSILRSFLRYLCLQGLVDTTLIHQVPKVRVYAGERLPTTWTPQQVQTLLATVDRASPLGKRDYAILLLATRLGLRAGDIRDLTLEQLDWEHSRIRITQAKTGVPLDLPLSEEVGQALINYLRHGRPATSRREIFLRHNAPFEPMGPNNNLHSIITSYRRKAGIELPAQSRCGLHSLRHSLASRLLEAKVPLDAIAGVLGHLSPETTRRYLRIDIDALRCVALDPEEVAHV